MAEVIISLEQLTKQYDETTAVDHLTLHIEKGEIFGLLGPNGAGKSTTILMMLGLTEPTSGAVSVCGVDSIRNPIEVKRKVGYLPDDVGFYDDLSGLDNLLYTARLNRVPMQEARERAKTLLKRVGLAESADKKAGKYSRGMRQRLGLADLLIKNPEVIILDEPTLGIDPEGVREFLQMIRRLSRDEGITVLLSSHHLHQVQQICDRVGLFVRGKLLAEGDIRTLADELFSGRPLVVQVKAPEIPESCLEKLNGLDGVTNVFRDKSGLSIECEKDVTANIARTIIDATGSLDAISKRDYGLDEIYHQYFEGGEARAQP
ncbi:MAG TPA: ABC transporter ATP-binding protein [Bacillales bacterium]|nr:ABC transporter ATP-binding protein [Bacillales bacterium]